MRARGVKWVPRGVQLTPLPSFSVPRGLDFNKLTGSLPVELSNCPLKTLCALFEGARRCGEATG